MAAARDDWGPGRALVTGGAGFLGSHLCERLLDEGAEVICLDNLSTGARDNVAHLIGRAGFTLWHADLAAPIAPSDGVAPFGRERPVDTVLHLASPASPRDYLRMPIETLRVGSTGTFRALELARELRARFLLASTSEVYGDPLVHPQPEGYRGNVDPVGPRSVYDEAKRFSEAATAAFARQAGLEVRIARIFNTYGPRMRPDDGRVIPTFVHQALSGRPFTINGDGEQTRSLCYVSDMVEGLWRLLRSDVRVPVNLGNPVEHSVLEVAAAVARTAGVEPDYRFNAPMSDDPRLRRPDIGRAQQLLGWRPKVSLADGLRITMDWFRSRRPGQEERSA
jgi:dTDP-glucose 4,6-dehydratase